MTDKKERIVLAALKLFAEDGFNGTSTIRIAREAKVSEGLIFKHFKNKQGLLDKLIDDLKTKLNEEFIDILNEKDPKKILNKSINAPFKIPKSEYNYWRLQYLLKMNDKYYNRNKMQHFIDHIQYAFKKLEYKNPNNEAILLNEILDSLFLSLIRGNIKNTSRFKKFLLEKYNLT